MEYNFLKVNPESLRFQQIRLDMIAREENAHIWKNMIRIEQIKKANLRKKDELLRKTLKAN